jgi:adenylate kinase family enzyme
MATLPKAAKPWWPDRTVLDNPDDPEDLSGRAYLPTQSYEETLLNTAGGDDKGIMRPAPEPDIDRRMPVYAPELIEDLDEGDAGFTRIAAKTAEPEDETPPWERRAREPAQQEEVGTSPLAKELQDRGVFDDLGNRQAVERQLEEEGAQRTSSRALFGDWDNLDDKGRADWIKGEKDYTTKAAGWWTWAKDNLADPSARNLEAEGRQPAGESTWLQRKVNEQIAFHRQRREAADLMEMGLKEGPRTGTGRLIADTTGHGIVDGVVANVLKGVAYAGAAVESIKGYDFYAPDDQSPVKLDTTPMGTVQERALYKVGKDVSDWADAAFPKDEARANEFKAQFGEGLGSMIGFMGPAAALNVARFGMQRAGLSLIPNLIANPYVNVGVTAGGAGAMSQAGAMGDDALKAFKAGKTVDGVAVDEDDIFAATLLALPIGATEAAPIAHLFHGQKGAWIKRIFAQAYEEGGQEFAQSVAENVTARHFYDDKRRWDDSAWDGALIGGLLGAKSQAIADVYRKMRGQEAEGAPAATPVREAKVRAGGVRSDVEPGAAPTETAPAQQQAPAFAQPEFFPGTEAVHQAAEGKEKAGSGEGQPAGTAGAVIVPAATAAADQEPDGMRMAAMVRKPVLGRGLGDIKPVGGAEAVDRVAGQEAAPPSVAVGDEVQWTSGGTDQFTEPRKVTWLSPDGRWATVEGSNTGVPAAELTKAAPAWQRELATQLASIAKPLTDEQRSALERDVDQNLAGYGADIEAVYNEQGVAWDLGDEDVRSVAFHMAQGLAAEEALERYAVERFEAERAGREEAQAETPTGAGEGRGESGTQPGGRTAAAPAGQAAGVPGGARANGPAAAGVGATRARPGAGGRAQPPGPSQRAAQQARQPGPAEREHERALRQRFRSLLAGKSPKSSWARMLNVDEAKLGTLVDEAVEAGLLQRYGAPDLVKAIRTAPSPEVASELNTYTRAMGEGAPTPVLSPEADAHLKASVPNVRRTKLVRVAPRESRTRPLAETQAIPPDVRIASAVRIREAETGKPVSETVRNWAETIETARGTPAFEREMAALTEAASGRAQTGRAGRLSKAEVLELAHLVGRRPTAKTTKEAALASIQKRHDDLAKYADSVEMAAFAEQGQDQRRAFDSLGFYSQALEAAKALKQEKGTPEQMRSMLTKGTGVKEAELAATKLDTFLEGKKSITKSDIVSFLEEHRVELRESVYGGPEFTALVAAEQKYLAFLANDYPHLRPSEARAMMEEVRDGETAPTPDLSDEQRGLMERLRAAQIANGPARRHAKYTNWTVDPRNPTNREQVVSLGEPETVSDARAQLAALKEQPYRSDMQSELDRLRAIVSQWDGGIGGYQEGHYSEIPGYLFHSRTSLQKDAAGKPVFLVDELQASGAQKLRDGGARDEAKIAELATRLNEARDQYNVLADQAATSLYGANARGMGRSTTGEQLEKQLRASGRKEDAEALGNARRSLNLLDAEHRTATAATPGHPLVNTTDQWTTTAFRRLIRQAVEAGAESIAISPGNTSVDRYPQLSQVASGLRYNPKTGILEYAPTTDRFRNQWQTFTDNSGRREFKPGDLPSVIGKEMTEALLAKTPAYDKASQGEWHTLSDLGQVQIGGHGMLYAYDQMYPRMLSKLLSKMDPSVKGEEKPLKSSMDGRVFTSDREKVTGWETAGGPGSVGPERKGTPPILFHTFPLTDKVKASVLSQGMPLFSFAGFKRAVSNAPNAIRSTAEDAYRVGDEGLATGIIRDFVKKTLAETPPSFADEIRLWGKAALDHLRLEIRARRNHGMGDLDIEGALGITGGAGGLYAATQGSAPGGAIAAASAILAYHALKGHVRLIAKGKDIAKRVRLYELADDAIRKLGEEIKANAGVEGPQLFEAHAQKLFGKPYSELPPDEQRWVRQSFIERYGEGQPLFSFASPRSQRSLEEREAAARGVMESPAWKAAGEKPADPSLYTYNQPGYMRDPTWIRERRYAAADGREIKGVADAVRYLADQAEQKVPGGVAREKQAYLIIGYPGAGKSTIARALSVQFRAAHMVSDIPKDIIPEYDGGKNGEGVHEESSKLAKLTTDQLIATGDNVVVETLGSWPKVADRAAWLWSKGYAPTLIFIDTPKAIAMERAVDRWRRSGRAVPLDRFDDLNPSEAYANAVSEEAVYEHARVSPTDDEEHWVVREATAAFAGLADAVEEQVRTRLAGGVGGAQRGLDRSGAEQRTEADTNRGGSAKEEGEGPGGGPQGLAAFADHPYADVFKQALPEFAPALEAQLRRMLPEDVAIRMADRLFHASGAEMVGSVSPRRAHTDPWIINIALGDRTFAEALSTGAHEAAHVLRGMGLWSDPEWKLLTDRAQKLGQGEKLGGREGRREFYRDTYRQSVEEHYPDASASVKEAILKEMLDQEMVSHMVEDFVAGKASYGTAIDRLLERIAKFFEAVRNALNGLGFRTADAVLEQAFGENVRTPEGGERIEPTFGESPEMAAISQFPERGWASPIKVWEEAIARHFKIERGRRNPLVLMRMPEIKAFFDAATIAMAAVDPSVQNIANVLINTAASVGLSKNHVEDIINIHRKLVDAQKRGGERVGSGPEMAAFKPSPNLDMSPDARKARAEAMGFDTSRVWFHGTGRYFSAFDGSRSDRRHSLSAQGVFFSSHRETASGYANARAIQTGREGLGRVVPVYVRGRQAEILATTYNYPATVIKDLEKLKAEGFASVVLRGNRDAVPVDTDEQGRHVYPDELVVFDPANIRSVDATFDPAQEASSQLMAAFKSSPDLDMSPQARKARAEAMGFDASKVYYHGTPEQRRFDAFDLDRATESTGVNQYGRGIYLTSDSSLARSYKGGLLRGHVREVYVRLENPFMWNDQSAQQIRELQRAAREDDGAQLTEQLQASGHDGVIARYPDGSDEVVVFDPSNIRSVNASFDPASEGSSVLMAAFKASNDGNGNEGRLEPSFRRDEIGPGYDPRAQGLGASPRSLTAIIADLKRALQMPVTQGLGGITVRNPATGYSRRLSPQANVAGQYQTPGGVARIRLSTDIDAIAHEGGHHLEHVIGEPLRDLIATHAEELSPYAGQVASVTSEEDEGWLSEGFAEFFRDYVLAPEKAQVGAPGFYQAFNELLDAERPDILDGLDRVQLTTLSKDYQDYQKATAVERLVADVATLRPPTAWDKIKAFFKTDNQAEVVDQWLSSASFNLADMTNPSLKLKQALLRQLDASGARDAEGRPISLRITEDPHYHQRMLPQSFKVGHQLIVNGVTSYGDLEAKGPTLHGAMVEFLGGRARFDWTETKVATFQGYLEAQRAIVEWARNLQDPAITVQVIDYYRGSPEIAAIIAEGPREGGRRPYRKAFQEYWHAIEMIETTNPRARGASVMARDWQHRLLTLEWQAGLWSDEEYRNLSRHKNYYVPNQRDFSDVPAVLQGIQAAPAAQRSFQKAKPFVGSDRNIIGALETMAMRAYATAEAIQRNEVARAFAILSDRVPGAAKIVERIEVEETLPADERTFAKLTRYAVGMGMDPQDAAVLVREMEAHLSDAEVQLIYNPQHLGPKRGIIMPFWENGERKLIRFNDALNGARLLAAMNEIGRPMSDILTRVVAFPAEVLRAGVVMHPAYIMANIIGDMQNTLVLTGAPPVYTHLRGAWHELSSYPAFRTGLTKLGITPSDVAQMQDRVGLIAGGQITADIQHARGRRQGVDLTALRNKGYQVFDIRAMAGLGTAVAGGAVGAAVGAGAGAVLAVPGAVVGGVLGYRAAGLPGAAAGAVAGAATTGAIVGATLGVSVGAMMARMLFGQNSMAAFAKFSELSETFGRRGVAEWATKRAKAFDPSMSEIDAIREGVFTANDTLPFDRRGFQMGAVLRAVSFFNGNIQGVGKAHRQAWMIEGERGRAITIPAVQGGLLGAAGTMFAGAAMGMPAGPVGAALGAAAGAGVGWTLYGAADMEKLKVYLRYALTRRASAEQAMKETMSQRDQKAIRDGMRMWIWLSLIGVAGAALAMLYKDDPEYDDIRTTDDQTKYNHWVFKAGDTWYRLKRFEFGYPAIATEAAFDLLAKGDPRVWEKLRDGFLASHTPPVIPQALNLQAALRTGVDPRTGRPIVPDYASGLSAVRQRGPYTSAFANEWATALHVVGIEVSPYKIDYALQTELAYWGREIKTDTDYFTGKDNRAPKLTDYPIVGTMVNRFTLDPSRRSESVREYWRLAGKGQGPYAAAAKDYDDVLKSGSEDSVKAFLAGLKPEERVYAVLDKHFKPTEKEAHPLNRARAIFTIDQAMKREMAMDRLVNTQPGQKGETIPLSPQKRVELDDILGRLSAIEVWNALHDIGRPGWEKREIRNPQPVLDELKGSSEPVFDELMQRRRKAKVGDYADDQEKWLEVKDRVEQLIQDEDMLGMKWEKTVKKRRSPTPNLSKTPNFRQPVPDERLPSMR